jgi:type IV pilus assembly protein PilM
VTNQWSFKKILGQFSWSSTWYAAFAPDNTGTKWAVIEQTSKGPVLRAHGIDATAEQALEHTSKAAVGFLYVASVLPSSSTLCRQMVLPRLQPHEVEAALLDTLEQTLAVGVNESVIAHESMPTNDDTLRIVAYLTRQASVSQQLDLLHAASIEPEWIIPKAAALAAFIDHFGFPAWHYVIDIGADEITIVLVHDGKVIESRSLAGSAQLFSHLETPSPDTDEQLRCVFQHMAEAIVAYKERYGIDDEASLTVTGDVLAYPMACPVMAEYIQVALSPLHASNESFSLLQCASAIGAAFISQKAISAPIPNFRIPPFAFPSPFLHLKRPLVALGLGCICVAALIAYYGQTRSTRIVDAMRADWKKITELNHMSPEEVNRQSAATIADIQPPDTASSDQMIAQGEWLLASVERMSLYPLQPCIPKLSDVMVWLSSQMDEVSASMMADAGGKMELQSLVYQLVKHPTKTHPQERYQVRVDIEFSTPSVAMARALHDRLASPNQCIDSSSEIRWTPSNGRYRASFFLKDATFYPPRES